MDCLLIKCHKNKRPGWANPIVTEPLELEYLAGMLTQAGFSNRLYDPWLEQDDLRRLLLVERPQWLGISCYITGVPRALRVAAFARRLLPGIKIVVGGVHAEVNPEDFYHPAIDFILQGRGEQLVALMQAYPDDGWQRLSGLSYRSGSTWSRNPVAIPDSLSPLHPNRSYLRGHLGKTRYLDISPIILVQTAVSCPYNCAYCYCRLLNQGEYQARPMPQVIAELAELPPGWIWLIDDSFLLERSRVEEFISLIEAGKIQRKFIAYGRTDFIRQHADLLPALKRAGLKELIVGMESIEEVQLKEWNKDGGRQANEAVIQLLKAAGINLTALLMVDRNYSREDFRRLDRWLARQRPDCYTVSILTPLPGTAMCPPHGTEKDALNYSRYDFLHLVIPPTQMTSWEFYLRFWLLHRHQGGKTFRRLCFGKGGGIK